jgi:hypothetical protein
MEKMCIIRRQVNMQRHSDADGESLARKRFAVILRIR